MQKSGLFFSFSFSLLFLRKCLGQGLACLSLSLIFLSFLSSTSDICLSNWEVCYPDFLEYLIFILSYRITFPWLGYMYSHSSVYKGDWFQDPRVYQNSHILEFPSQPCRTCGYKKLALHIHGFYILWILYFWSALGWKKFTYKWICVVQACVVQGSTIFNKFWRI